MIKNKSIAILLLFLSASIVTSCRSTKTILVVSYNVENMFDTIQNSGKLDNEFIPEGKKKYNTEKYNNKLHNIAKVIASIDSTQLPDLVGLIEIENRKVAEDLAKQKILESKKYNVSHFEGPDPRGIEVALLYSNRLTLLNEYSIPVYTDTKQRYRTRDILYVKAQIFKDTLHIFVNHWKSRVGGAEKTEPTRQLSAQVLKKYVDSIHTNNPISKIIIVGDFNDTPADSSIYHTLEARKIADNSKLINIMYPLYEKNLGTNVYKNQYFMLDNIIISQSIIKAKRGLRSNGIGYIFSPDWISYKTSNGIMMPARTFSSDKYFNGYSDHYPVYFYLNK